MTYKIVRRFANGGSELLYSGVSLEEAQEHCKDPDTSSRTCTTEAGTVLTEKRGPWFDGYDEE